MNAPAKQETIRLRKQLTGVVVSDKMEKTVVVRTDRRMVHPLYGKVVVVSKKFVAHDESNAHKIGDEVLIRQTKPLSKTKRRMVVETLVKAPQVAKPAKASSEKKVASAKAKAKTKATAKRKK